MLPQANFLIYVLLASSVVQCKQQKKLGVRKGLEDTPRGTDCYNCLSYDHPGCWNPDHPDYANVTVPNTNCYIPGMNFLCIIITSESAKLIKTGKNIGPVRARTCVPAKDFSTNDVSYSMCSKISKELSASEIFSKISVVRPYCSLCRKNLCTDSGHC